VVGTMSSVRERSGAGAGVWAATGVVSKVLIPLKARGVADLAASTTGAAIAVAMGVLSTALLPLKDSDESGLNGVNAIERVQSPFRSKARMRTKTSPFPAELVFVYKCW
jgi:hypothetical protein